jgi:hypothetical protein
MGKNSKIIFTKVCWCQQTLIFQGGNEMTFARNQQDAPHSDQQVQYFLSLDRDQRNNWLTILDQDSINELALAISAYSHNQSNSVDDLSDLLESMSVGNAGEQRLVAAVNYVNNRPAPIAAAPTFSSLGANSFFVASAEQPPRQSGNDAEMEDAFNLDSPRM